MGMECLHCKCILLNVNVYGPTELKSLPHIFKSVYMKGNFVLNNYFVFVYCWIWAGSPMWARLNPAHMPKEVEAVVLETTALNCSCTLNVHERDGDI